MLMSLTLFALALLVAQTAVAAQPYHAEWQQYYGSSKRAVEKRQTTAEGKP